MATFDVTLFGRSLAELFSGNKRGSAEDRIHTTDGRIGDAISAEADNFDYDYIDPKTALKCATVSTAVKIVSSGLGQVEFSSPQVAANRLLHKPNLEQTQFDFISSVIHDLLVYGNAFTQVMRHENQQVHSLLPLDPDLVTIYINEFNRPFYKVTNYEDHLGEFDVIHFRDHSTHGIKGEGRIQGCASRIHALIEADHAMARDFKNGHDSMNLVTPKVATETSARKKTGDDLKTNTIEKKERIVVMGIPMDVHEFKRSNNSDMDLRALRKDLIAEIAAHFQIPPFKLGGSADTKYANYSAGLSALYRDTYAPLLRNMKQRLEIALSTDTTLVEINFNEAAIVTGDLATSSGITTQSYQGKWMTFNEARELNGYTRIKPGDEAYEEWMDKFQEPSNGPAPAPIDPRLPGDRSGETTDDGDLSDLPEEE